MAEVPPHGVPGPKNPSGGILTKKIGPLPTWGWMAVGLGVAVIIATVKKDKTDSTGSDGKIKGGGAQSPAYGEGYSEGVDLIGGSQRPPVVFQNFTSILGTPAFGGRPFPPSAGPRADGQWVTIAPWKKHGAPWDSTLAGIAQQLYGDESLWTTIWNAPANRSLMQRRKDPKNLQNGDKVWVPVLSSAGSPQGPPPPPGPGMPPMPPPPNPGPPPPDGNPGHSIDPGRSSSRRHTRSR